MKLVNFVDKHVSNNGYIRNNINMKYIGIIYLFLFVIFFSSCDHPNDDEGNQQQKWILKKQLDYALTDSTGHNCIDNKRIIIKNKEVAISVIEPILFGLYGKDNIIKQKPYRASNIKNYWIIEGSLPKGYKGGTFFIIVDSRNGEIIKITHGK